MLRRCSGACLFALWVVLAASTAATASSSSIRPPAGADTLDETVPHRIFTRADGLPHATVQSLAQGPDGRLWIGTNAGLAVYDGHELRPVPLPDSLDDGLVCTLFVRQTGTVWASLAQRGVVAVRNGRIEHVTAPPPSGCVNDLLVRRDTLIAITKTAVWRRPPGASTFTKTPYTYRGHPADGGEATSASRPIVMAAAQAPNGSLWVLDARLGPGRLLPDGTVTFADVPRFADARTGWRAFQFARSGSALLAGRPGVYEFHPATGTLRKRTDTPYPRLTSHGDAVYGSRLNRVRQWNLRTGRTRAYGPALGLPSTQYYAVLEDDRGGLWIGTQQGLLYLPTPDVRNVTTIDGTPIRWTTDLAVDANQGEVWLSTWGQGLFRLAPHPAHAPPERTPYGSKSVDGHWTLGMQHHPGAVNALNRAGWFRRTATGWRQVHPDIQAIHGYVDTTGAGVFWTNHGICRTRPVPSAPVDTLWHWDRPARIYHRFQALDDGTLLLRTRGHLVRLSPYAPASADTVASFPKYAKVEARAMAEVGGAAWLGTKTEGLLRIDWRGDTTRTTRLLPGRHVFSLTTDGDSLLLAGTNSGLYLVDPASNAVQRRLTTADGLLSNTAWGRFVRDTLYVGHPYGMTTLSRRAALSPSPSPRPTITGVSVDGAPRVPTDSLRPAVGERTLTFRFAGIHLARGPSVRHAYRLLPYETTWHTTSDRRVRYTDLPPGSYTFQVRAFLASTSPSGSDPATLHVTLPPAFYETAWFWGLCGLALLGLLAAGYRWRLRRLRRRREELQALVTQRTRRLAQEKEKTQERAERLAALDAEKNRFFANISHELRTPLTVLRGTVEDALDGAFGDVPAPLRQQLETLRRHVDRLRRLANQLLDLSRLETTEPNLDAEPCDLVAFVRGLVQAHAPMADRRNLRLDLEASIDAHPCRFDPDKLEKVFANLLTNALQYTSAGGEVTVRLDVEAPDAEEEPPVAVVAVADTGRGIPPDQQDRIFDRFDHAPPQDGDASGTGIGLALAREYAELHGGTIDLESTPGVGSTFTVRLPLSRADADTIEAGAQMRNEPSVGPTIPGDGAATPADDAPASPAAGDDLPQILVADDNADVRAYLRRHLAADWAVREAADGAEALEQIREAEPAIVVADVMMPALDGLELTRRLRADDDLDRIPVLLLTARADADDAVAGLEAGADDYVTKPFSIDELRARIEQLLAAREDWAETTSPHRLLKPDVEMTPADEAFLDRVTTALEEHLSRTSLTVDDLAAEVSISARQLQRKLQRLTGCTAATFIRRYRLECAAALLADGVDSVSQVAYRVGFGTAETFARHFAEHFDCRPSAYARRHGPDAPDASV